MDNEREDLLRRLRAFLIEGADDPKLDEVELIEAFDYAGDQNDYDLQQAIIDHAAIRFPRSTAIGVRRAHFLRFMGDYDRADRVFNQLSNPRGFLAELYPIAREVDAYKPADEIFAKIEALIDRHDKINDEEMIRLCEITSAVTGGYQFLKDHLDTLRTKGTFKPTLPYEMAQISRQEGMLDDTEKYIEELTMIEPFEIDFWEMLAELYMQQNRLDDARNALEYALAINPKSRRSRLIDAGIRLSQDADPDEVEREIHDLIYTNQLDDVPLLLIVAAYDRAERFDRSKELILNYLEQFPASSGVIDALLFHSPTPEETQAALKKYLDTKPDITEGKWLAWYMQHYNASDFNGAASIMTFYNDNIAPLSNPYPLLISLYYSNRAGDMMEHILKNRLVPNHPEEYTDVDSAADPMVMLLFIMGLVRTNHEHIALQIISLELSLVKARMQPADPVNNIGLIGYRETLKKIRQGINHGTYPDKYDPFLHPDNLRK